MRHSSKKNIHVIWFSVVITLTDSKAVTLQDLVTFQFTIPITHSFCLRCLASQLENSCPPDNKINHNKKSSID